ncbi:hypothetical protein BD779DRAFT_1540963 [Infundibulicybe gibba]|nr:hypothetical protein BD779DRAFT_1540963 [Infundibulicybe gibba]
MSRIVVCDPRIGTHFYKLARTSIGNLFGRGLLWAEGESHRDSRLFRLPLPSTGLPMSSTARRTRSTRLLKFNLLDEILKRPCVA